MRIPVPKNELVALTLAGALLTAVVAGALAFPIPGVTAAGDSGEDSGVAPAGASQAAADVPTPNQNFSPAVQTQSRYEDEEHEAYEAEEHEDDEREEEYHEEEHEENEEHEADEAEHEADDEAE